MFTNGWEAERGRKMRGRVRYAREVRAEREGRGERESKRGEVEGEGE